MKKNIFGALLISGSCLLYSTEYFVDYEHGKKSNPGTAEKPFSALQQAVSRAKAGDTIRILPAKKPIRDCIRVRNLCGEPGKPIVIDGMMNTFTGTRRVTDQIFKELSPGLFCRKGKTTPGMVSRYFLRINGKQVRMGQRSKYKGSAKLKAVSELQPFEWTVVGNTEFYFRLPEGKKLSDYEIEEPCRISGAAVGGTSSYITISNAIFLDFWNDGLNIHNNSTHIVYENTAALFCGDDGASSHNDCETTIRNFVSIGNSTGICHIGNAVTSHDNIYIAGTGSRDVFLLSKKNILKHVYVDASAPGPFEIRGEKDGIVEDTLTDCIFVNRNENAVLNLGRMLTFDNVRLSGFPLKKVPEGVTVLQELPEAELADAKQKLFAVFGGRLEKLIPGEGKK